MIYRNGMSGVLNLRIRVKPTESIAKNLKKNTCRESSLHHVLKSKK